jgi:hypothetical protein
LVSRRSGPSNSDPTARIAAFTVADDSRALWSPCARMNSFMRLHVASAGAASLLWLLASACPASGGPLQATGKAGDYLFVPGDGDEGGFLVRPEGEGLELNLPPSTTLTALVVIDGGWIAAGSTAVDGRDRLLLLTADPSGSGVRHLTPPPGQKSRIRADPVLLVRNERLVGLAWLEGNTRRFLAVVAAGWNGSAWESPRTVSLSRRGSQLALQGVVLDDGTWLLVWSAFDGHDDELLWSQKLQQHWSEPRRLYPNNGVPDITPTLARLGAGALVAWSHYDGNDYRLATARFTDGAWEATALRGEPGSLEPGFRSRGEELQLLYQTMRPPGWAVLELDHSGAPRRRTLIRANRERPRERPLLGPSDSYFLTLFWASSGAESSVPWMAAPQ